MRIVVSGASGLVGTALTERLRTDGHDVLRLVRREPTSPDEVRWDPAAGRLDPGALDGVEAAVNLSGAGVGDKRWTDGYKQVIRQSRVDTTLTLSRTLAALDPAPRVLVQASAIGIYGDRGDEVLTEDSTPGRGFLADVVRDWEAAARPALDAGVRVAHLRTGLVMSADGGAFARLLPLFRLGLGGPLGRGRMWWSWITLPDVVGAVVHLLGTDVAGPVNVTGPAPVTNAEVTSALAGALSRPAVAAVPPLALRVVLGEFSGDVLASQRVAPQVLLDSGYAFRHPDVDAACRWLVGR